MAKQLRYAGEFLSRKGVTWRVEIWREADEPFAVVGDLSFDADNALTFEYSGDKTETIIGCTATIKIESPTDRAYIDLYTIAVGQIRMDVYREGALYWRGCLDPEFYEEPYEMLDHYTVTLTFSDFGILDRLVFNRGTEGMSNLQDLVQECLDRAGLEYSEWANRYENGNVVETISTDVEETVEGHLEQYSVRNANFYDEEGEASTLYEMLEGILQPLAVHIRQHDGRIYIYDYQFLSRKDTTPINWSGDSQTLGVDSVYNNVKVTWSPYAQNIGFPDEVWSAEIDDELCPYTIDDGEYYAASDVYVFGYDYDDGARTVETEEEPVENKGFSLWVDNKNVQTSVAPFKVVPFYKGEDCEGYALRWNKSVYNETRKIFTWYEWGFTDDRLSGAYAYSTQGGTITREVVIQSEQLSIPVLNEPDKFALLFSLETQLSTTTTPWHELEPEIEEQYYHNYDWGKECTTPSDWVKTVAKYILVPVNIYFDTDDGERYIWQNMDVNYGRANTSSSNYTFNIPRIFAYSWTESLGTWVPYNSSNTHQSYIAYYSTTDPTTSSPTCIGSWGTNNHFCGLTTSPLAETTKIEGQCVAYPNIGKAGRVTIEVQSGWLFYSYIDEKTTALLSSGDRLDISKGFYDFQDGIFENYKIYEHIRWVLCKTPKIEICNATAYDTDLNTDDVEYSAVINPDAKEDLEINTICGTCGGIRPTARGGYYDTYTQEQIATFWRASLSGTCEELYIATAFSQFAERHTTLSGEADIDPMFNIYSEQNQGDLKFFPTEVTENAITDTMDVTIIEFDEDNYEPQE